MRGRRIAVPAAAVLLAGPLAAGAQPACSGRPSVIVQAALGSSHSNHGVLNELLGRAGHAPIGRPASSYGLSATFVEHCYMVGVELTVNRWTSPASADGRRLGMAAGDVMIHGSPLRGSGTFVYPVIGGGVRVHYLEVIEGPPRTTGTNSAGAREWLRYRGDSDGPSSLLADLGVGADRVFAPPTARLGLVIGARMGYVLTLSGDPWATAADTMRGPSVNTSGGYGRVTMGVSYQRRRGGT